MILMGYEIREKQAMDSVTAKSLDYPLGPGIITMDSTLCMPCWASGYIVKGHKKYRRGYRVFLIDSFEKAKEKYETIDCWYTHVSEKNLKHAVVLGDTQRREDYSIFAYFLGQEAIELLSEMEQSIFADRFRYFRELPIIDECECLELGFKSLGFDIVEGLWQYDRWQSILANEGIPLCGLRKYGVINGFGLYDDLGSAEKFAREMNRSVGPNLDPAFVVKIMGFPPNAENQT